MPIDQAAEFDAQPRFRYGARPVPLLGLFRACHPAPAMVVAVLATALTALSGRGATGCALAGLAVLSGQLSVGWCNDRVDLRRDIAAGRADKPLVTGDIRPAAVSVAAGVALAACVPFSLGYGLLAGTVHLVGVAAAWSYNLGVKATVASWLPYAIGFGLLPAAVTLGLPGHPWPAAWAVLAGALLGVGAHAANVLPDIEADTSAGVRGLPQRLGRRRTRVLAVCALFSASAVLVFGPAGPVGAAGWAALAFAASLSGYAVAAPGSGAGGRTPFLAAMAIAVVDVALLLLRGATLA
ncbi:UbiA family prenyltransferase [Streptantibioticus ferralitis]|uniref:UbiA family prenyltransferase n=1 Tax=Streptantibioticus ferralitis TaxID=236510 RepID=A0ABT5YTD0_9ACTN|nr:UbiA family prenyltransferase [Streptantibioticus ferralitis]MDF2254858.1 UbiA family prenyltransferase [Streptantibioticus ferralitis]